MPEAKRMAFWTCWHAPRL